MILVSRAVADALSDESLDEIAMHEQAHLDRYDDWSLLVLAVVGSLAGLHPAVRFLARRLDVDREAACDDRVMSRTGATRRYASSLLTAAAANPEAGDILFASGRADRNDDGIGPARARRPSARFQAGPGRATCEGDEPRERDGSGARRRTLDAGGPRRDLP